MDRIENRQTSWFLINIKARREQTIEHYLRAFQSLKEQDPVIKFHRGDTSGSIKSVLFSDILDSDGYPNWIQVNLLSYTIIDPTAFYNKRKQEDVTVDDWDKDIVANKKESQLFFIPSVHTMAMKCNSKITLNKVLFYFSEALNIIEPDTFDVDTIKDSDCLQKILSAYRITHFYANISFSNHDHSDLFCAVFDSKLRDCEPNRFEVIAQGSKEHPLKSTDDGLIEAMVRISENNGYVKATIQETKESKLTKIDSSAHPRKLSIPQIINGIGTTLYNYIRALRIK